MNPTQQTIKTFDLKPNQVTSNKENYSTANPLPSGALSITKTAEELNLRPLSPHRYNCRIPSKFLNSEKSRKHVRSSTECLVYSKFIPATELVSGETEKSKFLNEKISVLKEKNQVLNEKNQVFNEKVRIKDEDESENDTSRVSFEDEQVNLAGFPTLYSNRNSLIASAVEAPTSAGSSPFDQRLNSVQTVSSRNSCYDRMSFHCKTSGNQMEFQKLINFKTSFVANEEKVYCEDCNENVGYFVKVRKGKRSL